MVELVGTEQVGWTLSEPEPLLLSVSDAARMLAVSVTTVRAMARAGQLPLVRIGDRVLFPVEDLRLWVQRRKVEPSE